MKLTDLPKWLPIILLGGGVLTFFWNLPEDVSAMKAQVQQIQDYIVQDKETQMALQNAYKNAPPGWRWEPGLERYVQWPEDPRINSEGETQ